MYITLETINVWSFQDEFVPVGLIRQLGTLLQEGDIIALGAYSPSSRLTASLITLGATETDAGSIYSETFGANRRERPNGRSFELSMTRSIVESLMSEAQRDDGQDDKPLFFDHLMAYRRGTPVVPLVCFHDAFFGGEMRVSGHYSENIIQRFAQGLPSSYRRDRNPDNHPVTDQSPSLP
jgi:hypothetical protein